MNRIQRWLHCGWLVVGLATTLFLIFAGGGHPPPIVLLPAALITWAAGHGAIWGVGWLVDGRHGAGTRAPADGQFPLGLRLALFGSALSSAAGAVQLGGALVLQRLYPFREPGLWMMMLIVALLHAICFTAILAKRPWAGGLASLLALGWSIEAVLEILTQWEFGTQPALLMVSGRALLFLLFSLHLASSPKIRSYLRP